MSRALRRGGAVHKESLPAHGAIKRRRRDDATATATATTTRPGDAADTAPRHEHDGDDGDKKATGATPTPPPSREPPPTTSPSSSSGSDDDDEDDDDAIARETARLAQLRARRQANAGGDAAPRDGATYDYDVLFRRPEWRRRETAAAPRSKWAAVVNNKQDSAAFQQFMRRHFK